MKVQKGSTFHESTVLGIEGVKNPFVSQMPQALWYQQMAGEQKNVMEALSMKDIY